MVWRPNQETQIGEARPSLDGKQARKTSQLFRVVERDRNKVKGGLKADDPREA